MSAITSNDASGDEAMLALMVALEGVKIANALGGSAYDTIGVCQFIQDIGSRQIILPKRIAKQQKAGPLPAFKERDNAIQQIKELEEEGRNKW